MKVAFFADDASAHDAALLTAYALSLNKDEPSQPSPIRCRAWSEPEGPVGDAAIRIMALPLSRLSDPEIRRHVDLAIVSHGPAPGAAAGTERAIAALATTHDSHPPPWLLPCGHLAETTGFRTIPVRMPGLRRDEAARLREGQASQSVARLAIALTASLLIAAADPFAVVVDRARVLAALSDDPSEPALALRDRLLDLADTIDDADWNETPTCARTTAYGRLAPERSGRSLARRGRRTVTADPALHRRALTRARAIHA